MKARQVQTSLSHLDSIFSCYVVADCRRVRIALSFSVAEHITTVLISGALEFALYLLDLVS
jgi:hypothetical protein